MQQLLMSQKKDWVKGIEKSIIESKKGKRSNENLQMQSLQVLAQNWFQHLQMAEKLYMNEKCIKHKLVLGCKKKMKGK